MVYFFSGGAVVLILPAAELTSSSLLSRRIGRDLSQTCAKMERLAEMAKKKSLFDEKSDMDHLSRVVKEVCCPSSRNTFAPFGEIWFGEQQTHLLIRRCEFGLFFCDNNFHASRFFFVTISFYLFRI